MNANSETTLALNDAISEKSPPFLSYDCARCKNEICMDRESCLRWLTKDDNGYRMSFFAWAEYPNSKAECGNYLGWKQ